MIPTFNPLQWLIDRIVEGLQNLTGPLEPLLNLTGTTPLEFTTHNTVVMQGWQTMTMASDILLGLFVVIGAIQMMYGDLTGTLRMPIGQFIARIILTALLIHLSALIGENLLLLNNLLTGVVATNVGAFVRQVNNGQLFNNAQTLLLAAVMGVVFGIGLFRVIFQSIKRIIRFNVLFVLSGPAFLTALHPATSLIFSAWVRMYVITIFEQFVQFLTFGLGVQFLIATKQTGLTGFILAVAMLNLTAEIPALLERFGAGSASRGSGLGSLVDTAIKVAFLFV